MMDEEEKVANATHVDYLKIIKDAVLFYTTAFFVLLLIFR